jgi:hypothetical protein
MLRYHYTVIIYCPCPALISEDVAEQGHSGNIHTLRPQKALGRICPVVEEKTSAGSYVRLSARRRA